MITREQFWLMTDQARLEAEYMVDEKLEYLQNVPLEVLQEICLQYRYFTESYPDTLGILISKTPPGKFKSLIAEILSEELGSGNAEAAHLKIWDNFLISLGVNEDRLEISADTNNVNLLKELMQLTKDRSTAYAIGLRGMGGECLCQVYLTAMHKNMLNNSYIKMNDSNIDWTFWDIHVGEADIIHNQMVRQAINEMVDAVPTRINDLAAGYHKAKQSWDIFWNNIYNSALVKQA
ncbi:iron-containing redox enzyme family protein [aff. Roholtiella sp. LEGE 12411]|uniref:iron-containing redox enzyme family protein n=1 Tax=aff. Roholtiella sp. LEGE 12411 TaxID=1828822 RepID=UPI001882A4D9|nr:iron-containing redox enzyme family protein [aff. Roholtiella sp. LEGE 12411]MBE9033558.1 iron-containing redox enzyme family protein [aff. Roholtiella sp. LEGE 12411]